MTLGLSGATVGLSSFFGERRAHLRTPILIFKHLKLFLLLSETPTDKGLGARNDSCKYIFQIEF